MAFLRRRRAHVAPVAPETERFIVFVLAFVLPASLASVVAVGAHLAWVAVVVAMACVLRQTLSSALDALAEVRAAGNKAGGQVGLGGTSVRIGRGCCRRRGFDSELARRREALRFEFEVEVKAAPTSPIGIKLTSVSGGGGPGAMEGGLLVEQVLPGGLIDAQNRIAAKQRLPQVQAGDLLVAVNGHALVGQMMRELAPDSRPEVINMTFARPRDALKPEFHEVKLRRAEDTIWGIKVTSFKTRCVGDVLQVTNILAGSAVDRWNRSSSCRAKGAAINAGDWILACCEETDARAMIDGLRDCTRTTFAVVRWDAFAGEAEAAAAAAAPVTTASAAVAPAAIVTPSEPTVRTTLAAGAIGVVGPPAGGRRRQKPVARRGARVDVAAEAPTAAVVASVGDEAKASASKETMEDHSEATAEANHKEPTAFVSEAGLEEEGVNDQSEETPTPSTEVPTVCDPLLYPAQDILADKEATDASFGEPMASGARADPAEAAPADQAQQATQASFEEPTHDTSTEFALPAAVPPPSAEAAMRLAVEEALAAFLAPRDLPLEPDMPLLPSLPVPPTSPPPTALATHSFPLPPGLSLPQGLSLVDDEISDVATAAIPRAFLPTPCRSPAYIQVPSLPAPVYGAQSWSF